MRPHDLESMQFFAREYLEAQAKWTATGEAANIAYAAIDAGEKDGDLAEYFDTANVAARTERRAAFSAASEASRAAWEAMNIAARTLATVTARAVLVDGSKVRGAE